MKLAHIFTATNDNPNYSKFIPIFIEKWLNLCSTLNITILYISNNKVVELPEHIAKYNKYIKIIYAPAHINTAYIAQVIRLLWPALLGEKEGVLITDIDMLPGNYEYYSKNIEQYGNNSFISYRNKDCVNNDQIVICYNIASSDVWGDIFDIKTENDVYGFLYTMYNKLYDGTHGGTAWYSDQQILYEYIIAWQQRNGMRIIYLDDASSGFRRNDFYMHQYDKETFKNMIHDKAYSDFHLYSCECKWNEQDIMDIVNCITRAEDSHM